MSRLIALTIVAAVLLVGQRTAAQQNLTGSVLSRYLEALRLEAGIPGMSAVVLQDGNIIWDGNFGYQDIETATPPTRFTPYGLGTLSQIFGGTLLLKACVDERVRSVAEPVTNWDPTFDEPETTLTHLLAHVQANGAYRYDPARFSRLTKIAEACDGASYQAQMTHDVIGRLALHDSVPGTALASPTPADVEELGLEVLEEWGDDLRRMATPYRVDLRGRPTRSEVPRTRADAANGVVMSAEDLAKFDDSLTSPNPVRYTFLQRETQRMAWIPPANHLPTGLGWFVQGYNGQAVVWQFGIVPDAYSSLIVKLPNRRLTFILLANSDGLSAPFALERGDVTASLFARLFLRLYVP